METLVWIVLLVALVAAVAWLIHSVRDTMRRRRQSQHWDDRAPGGGNGPPPRGGEHRNQGGRVEDEAAGPNILSIIIGVPIMALAFSLFFLVVVGILLDIFGFDGEWFATASDSDLWFVSAADMTAIVLGIFYALRSIRFGEEHRLTGPPMTEGRTGGNEPVPVGAGGVPTLFGMRLARIPILSRFEQVRNFFFLEGNFAWLPTPIGGYIVVDRREIPIRIRENKIPTKNLVKASLNVDLVAIIENPVLFLNTTGILVSNGEGEGAFQGLLHHVVRDYVRKKDIEELATGISEEHPGQDLLADFFQEISTQAHETCLVRWGIRLKSVFYEDVDVPDTIFDAAARKVEEDKHRIADPIKRKNLIENALAIADEMQIPRKDALIIFQAEQGDRNVTQQRFVVDGMTELVENLSGLLRDRLDAGRSSS